MGEYRNRTTGEVKSQGSWRADFPNMSLPRVWKTATLDALDLDPVLPGAQAITTTYQTSIRDGVEQNANGDWVEKYIAQDMFADDADLGTKAEQEAAYQAELDARVAESNRTNRFSFSNTIYNSISITRNCNITKVTRFIQSLYRLRNAKFV